MKIHYTPWIGENYGAANVTGTRLLVLGESHYGDGDPDATVRYTQAYVDGQNHRFWTSIMQLVLGRPGYEIDRREFWHSVSFYNFIQEPVGDGPRWRPTSEMWARSQGPFEEVLNELKPRRILVLGAALWDNLPSFGRQGRGLHALGEPKDTWIYPYAGGEALSTWVFHPSSPKGANTLSVHPYVKELIRSRAPNR
ncbi:MAG: hypothetical protein HY900_16100 [Deltaproteobacteria bacterium]|nr:hypothetical protein [Deltaproteobacteria bacterium]